MSGSKTSKKRRTSKKGGSKGGSKVLKDLEKLWKETKKVNAQLRKNKAISNTLGNLAKIDYKDDRVNALAPFAQVGAEVSRAFGYGKRTSRRRVGGSLNYSNPYMF